MPLEFTNSAVPLFKVNLKDLCAVYYWLHSQERHTMGKGNEAAVKKHHPDFPLMLNIWTETRRKIPAPLPVSCAGLNQLHTYVPFGFVFSCTSLHLQRWNVSPVPNQPDIIGETIAKKVCQDLSAAMDSPSRCLWQQCRCTMLAL